MRSKAVLEFDYPEDSDELLFALKGAAMYEALANIKMQVHREFKQKADMAEVLARVRSLTDEIFKQLEV